MLRLLAAFAETSLLKSLFIVESFFFFCGAHKQPGPVLVTLAQM